MVTNLIWVNSSTSSMLQPWVQPEKASMSISYLRWRTRKGPFSLKIFTTLLPNSSIWEVNFNALKFTRQRNFWISRGSPLLASLASVLFKCTTLCFCSRGSICQQNQNISTKLELHQQTNKSILMTYLHGTDLIMVIRNIWPTDGWQWI